MKAMVALAARLVGTFASATRATAPPVVIESLNAAATVCSPHFDKDESLPKTTAIQRDAKSQAAFTRSGGRALQ